jgi:hypothetical protein
MVLVQNVITKYNKGRLTYVTRMRGLQCGSHLIILTSLLMGFFSPFGLLLWGTITAFFYIVSNKLIMIILISFDAKQLNYMDWHSFQKVLGFNPD